MSAAAPAVPRGIVLPPAAETGDPTAWWGMLFVVIGEAALFGALLMAYFYERSNAVSWPPDGIEKPKLLLPAIMTILLVSSSGTMVFAERAIRSGNQMGLRIGLAVSSVLAIAFVALQAYEYSNEKFALGDSVYSSLFFTITGLHGAHVIFAILLGLFVQLRAWLGHFDSERYVAIRVVSLYWHFVDAVWIFIILCLYLSPRVL